MSPVLDISDVITREPHRCWGCARMIPAGTKMQVTSGPEDGHWFRCYWCSICLEVMSTWHWSDLESIGYGEIKANEPEAWAEAEKVKNPIPDDGYICSECAEALGGIWPDGHVATFHAARCARCGKTRSLANVGDWDWPDGRSRGMRD